MRNGWRAWSWAALRALLGGYLVVHFAALLPWAAEVFSSAGMATAAHSPLFPFVPSPLWVFPGAAGATACVAAGAASAVALALGVRDRLAAGVALWMLACLFAANPLIANPSLPHVGWLLLAHTQIPSGPSLGALWRDPWAGRGWRLPPAIFAAGWVVMAVAYGYSGWTKLSAESWRDGTAMAYVLANPLARPTALRLWLLDHPALLAAATWGALGLELAAPALALSRRARPWLWAALLALQLGLLALLDFADLTWGMLVLQAWTFDPAWLSTGSGARARGARRAPSPSAAG